MTQFENNIKACEILEEIQERAGDLWGNCQIYTAKEVSKNFIRRLKNMLTDLNKMNDLMERGR